MSSEAVTYFPETLVSTSEARRPAHCELEVFTDRLGQATIQSDVASHLVGANTQAAEVSDELLMEQVRQGTEEALSLIFRRHARTVRNVAYRILRNEAEADDLVQEVFLFLFRKAALFDASQGTARSWIVHVTYHRAFDRRRYLNTRHFYTSDNLDDVAVSLADRRHAVQFHEQSIEGIWGKKSAANLRALLSADQLKTLELHFFEGYTLEEIAERTGLSHVNVRNHYYRGLEKLRKTAFARKLRSK
jgi:RNA polymerase sigma-70 factor (ECF subfamily)